MQLEEEHDERQKLVREKREVERQMQTLSEQKPARDKGPSLFVSSLRVHLNFWNLTETGFGFGGFLHLICKSETGLAKLLKPGWEMVLVTSLKAVQLCTLIALEYCECQLFSVTQWWRLLLIMFQKSDK